MLTTLHTIFEDIKKVPVNQLEELHVFIRELISKSKNEENLQNEAKTFYNQDFVNKIKMSREEIKNGETTKISLDELWK